MATSSAPLARRAALVILTAGAGFTLYDSAQARTLRLSPSAGWVWVHADGQASVGELAARAAAEGQGLDQEGIWTALDALDDAGLLDAHVAPRGPVTAGLVTALEPGVVVADAGAEDEPTLQRGAFEDSREGGNKLAAEDAREHLFKLGSEDSREGGNKLAAEDSREHLFKLGSEDSREGGNKLAAEDSREHLFKLA